MPLLLPMPMLLPDQLIDLPLVLSLLRVGLLALYLKLFLGPLRSVLPFLPPYLPLPLYLVLASLPSLMLG